MKKLIRRIFLGEEDTWFWFYIFTKVGTVHVVLYVMALIPMSYYGWYYDSIILLIATKVWLVAGAIYSVVWLFLLITQADQWLW